MAVTTSALITTVGPSVVGAAAKKLLGELLEYAKRQLSEPQRLVAKALSTVEIGKRIYSTINVKTLWNVEREVSLFEFYYPSRLLLPGSSTPFSPRTAADICAGSNVVIQGTAGQGKSIFLRYLYGTQAFCIAEAKLLPLFIELRRVRPDKTLADLTSDALERLGLPVKEGCLELYLSSGRLLLLLDGFDEVETQSVDSLMYELEHLSSKHESLRIIASSRPGAAVQLSSQFRVAKLDPLRPRDHAPFLEKVCADKSQAAEILGAIRSDASSLKELLTTPLLLTLLVILYRAQSTLPSTKSRFYEQLFDVMFFRHDQTKPGFRRTRYTDLDETKLKRLFEAFSFQTQVAGAQVLTQNLLAECLAEAAKLTGIEASPIGFQRELVKTACLLLEDGGELTFVHKSVAEYYAAAFVQRSSQEFAASFYEQVRQPHLFYAWRGELSFLSEIDTYRYQKYFNLPELEQLLSKFEENLEGSMNARISEFVRQQLGAISIRYSEAKERGHEGQLRFAGLNFARLHEGVFSERLVFALVEPLLDKFPSLSKTATRGSDSSESAEWLTKFGDIEDALRQGIIDHAQQNVRSLIEELSAERGAARREIEREESKSRLVPLLSMRRSTR